MAPDAVRDELVVGHEERGPEVRAAALVDRVDVRLRPAVVRDPVVVRGEQVVRRAADVLQRQVRGAVEVDARHAVRTAEAADVVLRGLDPQPARIVSAHRTRAVDGQDDVLLPLRDSTVMDRADVRQRDVRGRDAPRVECERSIAGRGEGRSGRGAERIVTENWPPWTAAPTAAYRR